MAAVAEASPLLEPASRRMQRVATEVAQRHAGDVDARARFPAETVTALKQERLLGAMVPAHLGGEGASLAEIADLCATLAQGCGSSAMVFAMHQIKLTSLISHGLGSEWHRAFAREIAARQLLIASSTTEAGIGGDLRNSICAVETEGGRFRLVKEAPVISYGAHADTILVTARKGPEAASSDQVLVCVRKADYTLERTGGWDTLGMRGTCSEGFKLSCEGSVEQIIPKPFSEIAAQSMLATSHILWSSVWFGIATDAMARAQAFVRAAARRQPGVTPPGALRLAEGTTKLHALKALIKSALARFEAAKASEDALSSIGFAVEMNNLKVTVSTVAAEVVQTALMITGIAGYKNDTPFSVARNLRDVLSAAIMISNDRILTNTSNLLLVSRFDSSLAD
ncbi:acyl-CoA dehydrogenase family protein [Labrys wisconsinensis]|uniref:Acyl-CoA dehydrogenase n=1 Tax=Labrys wisconsinensis TaxID=425677 RepID=A0ABU0IZ31_9HYPH|nr:acyl-CoA dehydrogenase family protein [Labrys wisconsinensis]MDQ0467268.1 acyl-CoA dehydrogenase [Labrys wisconsinensis]